MDWRHRLILVLVVALLLRVWGLDSRAPGIDEDFTIQTVSLATGQMVETLANVGYAPPLYYFLASPIFAFGGVLALKLLSVIFGVLTVAVVFFLSRSLFNQRTAFFSSIFMSFLPLAVFYSQHMRNYSLLMFLFSLSLYFLHAFCRKKDGRTLAALAIVNTAMLLTHYQGFMIVGSQFTYLLYMQKKIGIDIRPVFASFALSALPFFAWVILAGRMGLGPLTGPGYWLKLELVHYPYTLYKFAAGIDISAMLAISPFMLVIPVLSVLAFASGLLIKRNWFIMAFLLLPVALSTVFSLYIPSVHFRFLSYLLPLFAISISRASSDRRLYPLLAIVLVGWFLIDLMYYSISAHQMWNDKIGL